MSKTMVTYEVITKDARGTVDVDDGLLSQESAEHRAKTAITDYEAREAKVVKITREVVSSFKAVVTPVQVIREPSVESDTECVKNALRDYALSSGTARHAAYAAYCEVRRAAISQHGDETWSSMFTSASRDMGLTESELDLARRGEWGQST